MGASKSLRRFRESFTWVEIHFPVPWKLTRKPWKFLHGSSGKRSHIVWDWKLPLILPVEVTVEASSTTSAEAFNELRSLPRASMWFQVPPLTPTLSHELWRASTPSTVNTFHASPHTSPNLHAILLSSMMNGKQIEAWTGRSKLEASTNGSKLEASTEGSESSGNFHGSTRNIQSVILTSTTWLYAFLCMRTGFPRIKIQYFVIRLVCIPTYGRS